MSLYATAHSSCDTLRQEVLISGRHRLVTDEPIRLGGTDQGPAPHELLPAAVAACVVTTIRMYARTKGWELGELTVGVVYDHQSVPRTFEVDIDLPDGLTADQTRRIMRAAETCPIRRAIEAGMTIDERLGSVSPGGFAPVEATEAIA